MAFVASNNSIYSQLLPKGNTSHIKPWRSSDSSEKLDVDNGFLLCPNHDRLFDLGYITFDGEGGLMISSELSGGDRALLGIQEGKRLSLTEGNKKYLDYHRESVFRR